MCVVATAWPEAIYWPASGHPSATSPSLRSASARAMEPSVLGELGLHRSGGRAALDRGKWVTPGMGSRAPTVGETHFLWCSRRHQGDLSAPFSASVFPSPVPSTTSPYPSAYLFTGTAAPSPCLTAGPHHVRTPSRPDPITSRHLHRGAGRKCGAKIRDRRRDQYARRVIAWAIRGRGAHSATRNDTSAVRIFVISRCVSGTVVRLRHLYLRCDEAPRPNSVRIRKL